MATYPTTLPGPLAAGYSLAPQDQTLRTDMDVGAARVRRRSTARLDRVRVAFTFTDAEMAAFRAWFDDSAQAAGGSAWFDITLRIGTGGAVAVEARFTGPYSADLSGTYGTWRLTAELEVRNA